MLPRTLGDGGRSALATLSDYLSLTRKLFYLKQLRLNSCTHARSVFLSCQTIIFILNTALSVLCQAGTRAKHD